MPTSTETDHDLLIRLDETLKNLIAEIKELREGTQDKISDHESRLRRLEVWGFMALGALAFIQLLPLLISFIKK